MEAHESPTYMFVQLSFYMHRFLLDRIKLTPIAESECTVFSIKSAINWSKDCWDAWCMHGKFQIWQWKLAKITWSKL